MLTSGVAACCPLRLHCCGVSNPVDEAVQRSGDALLACEMNGRYALKEFECEGAYQ